MAQKYLEIEGKRYIGIGDGNWLRTFQELIAQGWGRGYTTKDGKGRYWLVMEKK